MADDKIPNIAELHSKLIEVQAAYDIADKEASYASSRRTSAINALNEAQKAFDAGVEAVRKAAPRDSNWKQNYKTVRGECQ